jgi:hypothetical protein
MLKQEQLKIFLIPREKQQGKLIKVSNPRNWLFDVSAITMQIPPLVFVLMRFNHYKILVYIRLSPELLFHNYA